MRREQRCGARGERSVVGPSRTSASGELQLRCGEGDHQRCRWPTLWLSDAMARVIEYELVGSAGWARSAITLDRHTIELTASSIHDTLHDILHALLSACDGQDAVEWVYFHEPESTHVYLTYVGGRRLLTVRRYPDFRVPRPVLGDCGVLIGEGQTVLRDIVATSSLLGRDCSRLMENKATSKRGADHFPSGNSPC